MSRFYKKTQEVLTSVFAMGVAESTAAPGKYLLDTGMTFDTLRSDQFWWCNNMQKGCVGKDS